MADYASFEAECLVDGGGEVANHAAGAGGVGDNGEKWAEHHWPVLGVCGQFPAALRPVPFREGERSGLVLVDEPREFFALTRRPDGTGGDGDGAWRCEAARLTDVHGWTGAVVVGPYPITVGGMGGYQGWLRFQEPGENELVGLLWVGHAVGERVTVAYWSTEYETAGYAARYRQILDGLRWTAMADEGQHPWDESARDQSMSSWSRKT
jgi:hypothetical protein